MIISKITPIVNATAEATHFPADVVASVIKQMFNSIANYIQEPDKAGMRVTYLGVIRPHLNALNSYLKRLVNDIRIHPGEEKYKDEFRKLWKLRRLLQSDNKRRNFKKRYGKWHH